MRLAYIFIVQHFVSLPVRARFEAFDYPSAEFRIAQFGENSSALGSYPAEKSQQAPTLGNAHEYINDYNGVEQLGKQQCWPEIIVNEPYFKPFNPYLDNNHLNPESRLELENDSYMNFGQSAWSQPIDSNRYSGILNSEEHEFYTSTDFPRFESVPSARWDDQDFVAQPR
ncbi:hypothetical protein BY996DRAFT_8299233 [Phakopsora pachyrhizi]|nr:hypothetical protein BY996DRAFT_8299233 [Phakopsora pachyrhizi]